jgi:NAD(P)-dependent dehydrogenase (short-subunit alcohol dehydrogenase family)
VHVAAGYNSGRQAAEKLRDKLIAEGRSVSIHHGNVGRADDRLRVACEVLETCGRVDYLVNNAGVTVDKTVRPRVRRH